MSSCNDCKNFDPKSPPNYMSLVTDILVAWEQRKSFLKKSDELNSACKDCLINSALAMETRARQDYLVAECNLKFARAVKEAYGPMQIIQWNNDGSVTIAGIIYK
jgi:hypothetical protein